MRLAVAILYFVFALHASRIGLSSLNRKRLLKVRLLRHKKAVLNSALLKYSQVASRTNIDSSRLCPEALLFHLRPEIVLDFARICSRVSLVGQGKLKPISPEEHFPVDMTNFKPAVELYRGYQQVSGYVFAAKSRNKIQLMVCFAGTSSKTDVAHISILTESNLHNVGVHSGMYFLAYQNLQDLNDIVRTERKAGHFVELTFTGHSLGGAIALLAAFDLKKQWSHDRHVQVRGLNFAGPSPFKTLYIEKVIEEIGYGNVLSICRKADYIYQGASALGMTGLGPTIYLHDKLTEGAEDHPVLQRVRKSFEDNHYVTGYVSDLEAGSDGTLWEYIAILGELIKVEKEIRLHSSLMGDKLSGE